MVWLRRALAAGVSRGAGGCGLGGAPAGVSAAVGVAAVAMLHALMFAGE